MLIVLLVLPNKVIEQKKTEKSALGSRFCVNKYIYIWIANDTWMCLFCCWLLFALFVDVNEFVDFFFYIVLQ